MIALLLCGVLLGQPSGVKAGEVQPTLDWRGLETLLTDHVQLTFPEQFTRAGEAYFDHQTPPRLVIFQGTERVKGDAASAAASPNYAMYIARIVYDQEKPVAIGPPIRVSEPASANTCGWFHPTETAAFMYGTTRTAPSGTGSAGYQRGTNRYRWDFPAEMTIVGQAIRDLPTESIKELLVDDPRWTLVQPEKYKPEGGSPSTLVMLKTPPALVETLPGPAGYAAECSWSGDARHVIYTYVNPETNDPDIYVWDKVSKSNAKVVSAKGYDGGPFFSPDGRWICYRSDRRGDNNLQLFIAELAYADEKDSGRITGVKREIQVTDDAEVVNWAPFWHPSGAYLIYASSQVAHSNYEVFAVDVSAWTGGKGEPVTKPAPRVRVTHASGFDGLPAFSADGKYMLITSQRGPKFGDDAKPTSQLWIARVKSAPDFSKAEPLPKQFEAPASK